NAIGRVLIAILVLLSLLPIFFIVEEAFRFRPWSGNRWEELGRAMNIYVRMVGTLVGCLLLLAVAVRSAGCLGTERDKQTMDGLLTTPMDSASILVGKWVGSIASVRWAWIWLGLIWFAGVVTGGIHPATVPLVVAAWLVYAGCFAGIGMWFSLVCRTT